MISKSELDKLVEKYENEDFIKDDPIQFLHRFEKEEDSTIGAFVASCFAYGNRKVFIQKLNELFDLISNKPHNFVLNFDSKIIENVNYRFAKGPDVVALFKKLHELYSGGRTLKTLFKENYKGEIIQMLQGVCDYFYDRVELTQGYCHLIPNPQNGGAMKRMNMFLRWMVRKSSVDLGLWNFIPTSSLLIPLDVHVARISREMGLLKRNSNDLKAVIELTENLKQFDANDPVKYDFAMFGYGINSNNSKAFVLN